MSLIEAIRDSAAAIAPPGGGLARIRGLRFSPVGYDPDVWRQMGELGWIGLRVPEAQGGSGLGLPEEGALLEELGRALVPEPLIHGALSATILAAIGDTSILPNLLAGQVFTPLAWQEAPDSLDALGTAAPRHFIPMPPDDGPVLFPYDDGNGLALYETTLQGAIRTTMQDGTTTGTWSPIPANARRLAPIPPETLAQALEHAAIGTAFYLLGLAEQAFALTLDHLRTREQFGRKLGTFQALQHQAANLKISLTLTRASTEAAANTPTPSNTARAKTRAANTALSVTRSAVQLHGAIGYTDEYDLGLYLRKAMATANQYGSPRLHRQRFANNPKALSPRERVG